MVLSRGRGEVAPRPAVCLRPQLPGLPGRLTGPQAPGPVWLLRSAGTRRGCRAPQPERKRAALQDSGCWGPQPLPGAVGALRWAPAGVSSSTGGVPHRHASHGHST